MIDINGYILGLQFINFLIGLFIINYFIVTPIRKVLANRKEKIDNAQADISTLFSSAKIKLENYEAELKTSLQEAANIRNTVKSDAEKNAANKINEANEKARKQLADAYQNLQDEKEKALVSISAELDKFVQLAQNKLLA